MTLNTTLRRSLCAAGAAAALGLSVAGPASARFEPGEPVGTPRSGTTVTRTIGVPIDDNALELVQLGGGVLAGIALAGAGMALASRRHHAGAHPA